MAKKQVEQKDETRYCERCGISFLWSLEEQVPAVAQEQQLAHLCPGCRQLLPAIGRERGLVKWYHRRKGYGFLTRYQQPDLYVHRSALRSGRLIPDSLVEFTVGANQQGPVALDVIVLDQ